MPDPTQTPESAKPAEPAAAPAPEPAKPAEPTKSVEAAKPAEPEPAKPEDWRDKRIAELTHKLNEARRAQPQAPAAVQAQGETEAAFQARVNAEAEKRALAIAATVDWNRQCNEVAQAGQKDFPDFNSRLSAVQGVVNNQDPEDVRQYNEVLAAAIETGQAHRLIHALGENPGEVRRLMAASQVKRGVELARMADRLTVKPSEAEPSGAPKPVTPIGSHGIHYESLKPDDPVNGMKLPKSEWFKQREKQAAERGMQ